MLDIRQPKHRRLLVRWLNHADVLIGHNIPFDLAYLREHSPDLAVVLSGRHLVVDTSILNFLENDLRPERSLKALGPALGLYSYEEDRPTPYPDWESLARYNAEDTHNTILLCAFLCRRLLARQETGGGETLCHEDGAASAWSLHFYSDSIWSCLDMQRNGVPFDRAALSQLKAKQISLVNCISKNLRRRHGLYLSKKDMGGRTGCKESRQLFMHRLASSCSPPLQEHPLWQESDKTHEVFNEANRKLLLDHLPLRSPGRQAVGLVERWSYANKLVGTYCMPLLHHRNGHPKEKSSVLVRSSPSDSWLSHPSFFLTPSPWKDDSATEGGTRQVRPTFKNHSAQTDPPPIQKCYASRFAGGSIRKYDLSQIELRVAALLSGEPTLVDAYRRGSDVHKEMTVSCLGPDIVYDPQFESLWRQAGKRVNFLLLYRGGPDKLRSSIMADTGVELSFELCSQIAHKARSTRSVLWDWQEGLLDRTQFYGYIETPLVGQRRTFAGGEAYDVNEIVNYPIQSVAGAVMLRIQAQFKATPHILPFMNVYDALIVDVAPGHEAEADRRMLSATQYVAIHDYWAHLQDATGCTIPLTMEIPHGN